MLGDVRKLPLALSLIAACGCGGGMGGAGGEGEAEAEGAADGGIAGDGGDASGQLSVAFARIGESERVDLGTATLRFDEVRADGDVGSLSFPSVFVDLFGVPTVVGQAAAPGLYSRVRLDLASVAAEGVFGETPVIIADTEEDSVDLRSAGMELFPGAEVAFVVQVDLARWFDDISQDDLDEADRDGDAIRIDREADWNEDLAERIHENVLASFSLADGVEGEGEGESESEGDGESESESESET